MTGSFALVPAGDSAIVVEFEERIDPLVNGRASALADTLVGWQIPGVRDIVPTFRSVTVYFDPLRTDVAWLNEHLAQAALESVPQRTGSSEPTIIPVCYGGGYGPDLSVVAAFGRLTEGEVVALHSGRPYLVFMLGFVPGFAYMGTVDERIAAPRLATPRTRVPAGSVAIAGAQTGIYPMETPGGWLVIGRTSVKPFALDRPRPFLFKAGDLVQFHAIDRAEYERSAKGQPSG